MNKLVLVVNTLKRKISPKKKSLMKSFGWSETNENYFKKYNQDLYKNNKGTFQIQIRSGNIWYWFFKLSSGDDRLKYLCKCFEGVDNVYPNSFDKACDVLKKKINLSFKGIRVGTINLSKYIDEYIDFLINRGNLEKQTRVKGGITYNVLVKKDNGIETIDNPTTLKNKIRSINEFKLYCIEHNVKVDDVSSKKMKSIFKDFSQYLKVRGKRKFNGAIIESKNLKNSTLSKSTIKLFLQNTRYFLDWLSTDEDEYGRGLLKEHPITLEFQNKIIKYDIGKQQPRFDFVDFTKSNYEDSIGDTSEFIKKVWFTYCKNKGDIEELRTERLSYSKKTKQGGIVGTLHKNQPKDWVIMSDITYFISFLQLKYGFRISEILHSFRDKNSWERHADKNYQSSYFRKVKDENYYVLEIRNSKSKDRSVPIEETIWSFTQEPPNNVGKKVSKVNKNGKNYHQWETNIIDVIFSLFPKSILTFPSPNYFTKKNKGYSTTYYLNLFKSKMVNSVKNGGLGWDKRDIYTTHHLRAFFVSYMLREEGVQPTDVCEITGHSLITMINYYNRISEESKRATLQRSNLRDILKRKH